MQFANLQEFMLMDGHGPYVWLAVCVSLAVLVGLIISPLRQQRKCIDEIASQLSTDQSNRENEEADASDS